MPTPCLTEEVIAELVEGRLDGGAFESAERHLSECERCMQVAAAVGGALDSSLEDDGPTAAHGAPPPLGAGTLVGRYAIVEPVGAGAMGRVYAAHDPVLDRKVALKLLHPQAATDELETRLLREAKAMARLSHPEVITVHDAGRFADQLFIAMEFVDGRTLRQWLGQRRRPWREVLGVFLRAGRGLSRAHEAGIVHRDFKPDNVLVGDDGRVRVTDFGLARSAQSAELEAEAQPSRLPLQETVDVALTRTGALLGTPAYMAPEQHAGAAADERSDIFAFCVALYEGLYGERPFPGPTLAALAAQKRAGMVPMPRDERGVPHALRRVLLQGMRPAPELRFGSMSALLTALERSARPSRRWVGALAAAVVLLGSGVFAARGAHRTTAPAAATSGLAVATPRECTSHGQCVAAHGGQPYACRPADGVCVPMASEDCTPMFEPGDLEGDTVWLGAMLPVKGPPYGKMNMDGVELARQELAGATRGLRGATASMHVRGIAVVGCDDSVDARRAARHLVDDVGVPAILGFGSGRVLTDLAGSLLVPREVLSMATLTSSPFITRVPQRADLPRMVWRTSYSVEATADATAAFVHGALEPRLRAPMRVTLLRNRDAQFLAFAQRLFRKLEFNGKPAVDNGADYQELELAEPDSKSDVERVARSVVAGKPSIVIVYGDGQQPLPAVEAIEAQWPAGAPRPTYLLADDTTDALAPFARRSAQARRRVFAISAAAVPTTTAHFVMRFNLAYPGEATEGLNPSSSYDAFYMLAYAAIALGGTDVSGPALGRAISRLLPPGRAIETGSSDVLTAITALSRGANIDLSGPSGSLDLVTSTGEWSPDFDLTCAGLGGRGQPADVRSGATFVAARGSVEGVMGCH